jgi:ATP-binding cassette subfamily F protein 3
VSARAALTAGHASPAATGDSRAAASRTANKKDQKRAEAEQRQARSSRLKDQRLIVQKLEARIQELERRQTELTAELEKPETYETPGRANQVNRELLTVHDELATVTPLWETEATKLAAMD